MAFDVISHTLSAAVASAGTFTVSYPTDRSAGDYTGAHGHKLIAIGAVFSAPNDFTLTFNAGDITVTYNGSTTLPSGAAVRLQVDRLGVDDREPEKVVLPFNMARSNLHVIDLGSPDTADPNGYVESQDLTAAGVFSVNTTAAAALAAAALNGTADVPRNVVASWTGTAVLTVTGTDVDGNTLVESSASGTTLTGKKAFKTVTGISTSANITSLTVGTGDVLGLPVYVPDASYILAELEDGVAKARKPGVVYLMDHELEAAVDAGTSLEMTSPVSGTIRRLRSVARGTITTGGAVTVEVNTTAVDGLSMTIADGAVAGETDTDTPTAGHASTAVSAGDRIEIIPAAAFNASADILFILEIELSPSEQLDGTFVAAATAKATATTGDVRGTYDPTTACDGSTAFALLAALADPGNDGVPQFAG